MSAINSVGIPTNPATITRQERLTSANQNPPPESSPQALSAQQQQIDNAEAELRAQQRERVNELQRAQEERDNKPSELADNLRRLTTPTPTEKIEQDRNSADYGRFDIPMPVSDAMNYLLEIRDERRSETTDMFNRLTADTQAVNAQFASPSPTELADQRAENPEASSAVAPPDNFAPPNNSAASTASGNPAANTAPNATVPNATVYNSVNQLTASQVYEDQRNAALDDQAAVNARDNSRRALVDIFGDENILAREPAVPNYTVNPPESPNAQNQSATGSPVAASATMVTGAMNTPGINGTSAMRTLASGVRISSGIDPSALVNQVRPAVANQASALIDTQNLQNDYNTFSAMNNSISNIGVQSTAIYNASQDSIRTPSNALTNQRSVDDAVTAITTETQSVVVQSEKLRSVNAGELTQVNSTLRDLGSLPDPSEQNSAFSLQDLRSNGRASQTNDPEMAMRISETASAQISAVRNTVDTMQGNVLGAASATLDGAIRSSARLEAGISGQFAANANPIVDRETAQAVVANVATDMEQAPRRTLNAGSANISTTAAIALTV